jgi:hypothetical protein
MHGHLHVKFVNVKQAKKTYQYRNTKKKKKLYKTDAAIWYNKILDQLVGFIIRIYHDARSPERQIWLL